MATKAAWQREQERRIKAGDHGLRRAAEPKRVEMRRDLDGRIYVYTPHYYAGLSEAVTALGGWWNTVNGEYCFGPVPRSDAQRAALVKSCEEGGVPVPADYPLVEQAEVERLLNRVVGVGNWDRV